MPDESTEPHRVADAPPDADPGVRPATRTVLIALAMNAAVAVAKMAVGVVTRSSSIISEGWHAAADTGNEGVLLIAQRRSRRPPDARHPLGHGREVYFWALIAAVGVFVAGGLLSVRQGIEELTHPTPASNYGAAYAVLTVALVLEGLSLIQAWRHLHGESLRGQRGLVEHVRLTSEPTTRAVFAEDLAAVVGNLIALLGVGLHQLTGSAVPDGIASLAIGVLLAIVGIALAERNRDFLIGEPAPVRIRTAVERSIRSQSGIDDLVDLLVVFDGPRRAGVIAHVSLDPALTAPEVEVLVRDTAEAVHAHVPIIDRVEIVPTGASDAAATKQQRSQTL